LQDHRNRAMNLSHDFQQLTNMVAEKLRAMDLERQSFNKALICSNAINVLEMIRHRCLANGVNSIGIPIDVPRLGNFLCHYDG
jgi:hypothetical protein